MLLYQTVVQARLDWSRLFDCQYSTKMYSGWNRDKDSGGMEDLSVTGKLQRALSSLPELSRSIAALYKRSEDKGQLSR